MRKKLFFFLGILSFSSVLLGQNKSGRYFDIAKHLEIFANAYKEVNHGYVDELDPGQVMRRGLDAMLEGLDPFTNYISETDIEGYRIQGDARYNGIGATGSKMGEFVVITEIYENSPAQKSGLKVGDALVGIDGISAKGKTEEEVINFLRGFPGTKTQLAIRREGMLKDLVLTLERAEVEVPNVPYSGMVSEGVGYINLTTFTQQAADNISEALVRLKKGHSNLRGLILDLRGNGGGLLNEAVNIINIFVPKGLAVVSMRGKVAEWDKLFTTLSEPVDDTLAVVILVDKMSASASEVVSGSLQDLDRAVVMGQRTYGKGLVQNTKEVGYGAQVKLTTAKYYIPSGRCIQSVRYKDGEPVDIPDAERAQFRTRNGRLVLDGGGIKPDVVLAHDTPTVLVRALMEQHLIFDYVTRWAKSRPSIDSVEVFSFNAWDDFLEYTRERGFKYETKSEQTMRALRNSCRGEGYAVEAELARVDDRLRQEKLGDFERSRSQIIHEIEQEIVGRYYFHRGKVRKRLVNDSGVSAAVALINDMERYKALLSGN